MWGGGSSGRGRSSLRCVAVPLELTLLPISVAPSAVDLKPSALNSTSDSDLMRLRTVGRIPQVSLSPGSDARTLPPSAGEIEIIAPSRVKERTQNVTEKVTHVTQVRVGLSRMKGGGGGSDWTGLRLHWFLCQFLVMPVPIQTQGSYKLQQ